MKKRPCVVCKSNDFLTNKRCVTCPLLFCFKCYFIDSRNACDDCYNVYGQLYNIKKYKLRRL